MHRVGRRARAKHPHLRSTLILLVALVAAFALYSHSSSKLQLHPLETHKAALHRAALSTATQQHWSPHHSSDVTCGPGGVVPLGFDYPELRTSRALIKQWCSAQQQQRQQVTWPSITAAYQVAVDAVLSHQNQQNSSNSSRYQAAADVSGEGSASAVLTQLLQEASRLLSSQRDSLLHCLHDGSLHEAWSQAQTQQSTSSQDSSSSSGTPLTGTSSTPLTGTSSTPLTGTSSTPLTGTSSTRRYLLAANFHNSAPVLPNFVVQVLRLALVMPPGSFAVGIYESGSSDTSRQWLTLLHHLLLPLAVPHNITLGGTLSPRQGLQRIHLLAAVRNAAIEPWFKAHTPTQQQQQQHASSSTDPSAGSSASHSSVSAARPAAGSAALVFGPPRGSFTPDLIIYANDVLLCAEDALRLLLHDADIACGMDFYTAPWQDPGTAGWAPGYPNTHYDVDNTRSSSRSSRGSSRSSEAGHPDLLLQGVEDDDEFFDPVRGEVLPTGPRSRMAAGPTSSSSSSSSTPVIRFYDKWVSRDITGRRFVNLPPFIRHHPPSQAALSRGLPVPVTCCWNGLVVLAGAPFASGLRFRVSLPGECRASECSLMCEDFARLGLRHVVMDPGVRLAYELDQVDVLGGHARTQADGQQVKTRDDVWGREQGGGDGKTSDAVVATATSLTTAAAAGGGAAQGGAAQGGGGGAGGGAAQTQPAGLGPWLPWQQVAAASAAVFTPKAATAPACSTVDQGSITNTERSSSSSSSLLQPLILYQAQQQVPGPLLNAAPLVNPRRPPTNPHPRCSLLMECCDLLPGASYVDFRRSCHLVDVFAVNYTAAALSARV